MTWAKRGLGVLLLAGVGAAAMGGCGPSARGGPVLSAMERLGAQIAARNDTVEQAAGACSAAYGAEGVAACEKYVAALQAMVLVSLGEDGEEPSNCSTLIKLGHGKLEWRDGMYEAIGPAGGAGESVVAHSRPCLEELAKRLLSIRQVEAEDKPRERQEAEEQERRAAVEAAKQQREVNSRRYEQRQLMERAIASCGSRWSRVGQYCEDVALLDAEKGSECAQKCADAADAAIRSGMARAVGACAESDTDEKESCSVETGERDPQAVAQVVQECKKACPDARVERKKQAREEAKERAAAQEQARAARRQCVAQCAQTERSCKKECEPLVAAKGNCEYRCEVARRDCELGC